MSNYVLEWVLQLRDRLSTPLGAAQATVDKFSTGLEGAGGSLDRFGNRLFQLNQAAMAIGGMQSALERFSSTGASFEQQVANLDALTDIPEAKIQALAKSARELNLEFGGGAAQNVEAYKNILGRLGPSIADSPEALNAMGRTVLTLAKASGLDAVQSVDALTTSMLQFNDSLADPVQASTVMAMKANVLAAAAKVGAAEVPQLTSAINVAGTAAYNANVSFEETAASIEALAQGGKYGAEAGTALRNVLGKLEEGRFLPKTTREELAAAGVDVNILADKSLSLTDRLRELSKIQSDGALVTQMFGTENAAAANVLLRNISFIDETKVAITGTSTATEQANINMDTFSGKMERMQARMENVSISVFNATKEMLPFAHSLTSTALGLTQMLPAIDAARTAYLSWGGIGSLRKTFEGAYDAFYVMTGKMGKGIGSLSSSFGLVSTAATGAGTSIWAAMAPIAVPVGIAVAAIAALGAGIYYLYNRSESFRGAIDGIIEKVSDIAGTVVDYVVPILITGTNAIIDVFEYTFAFASAKIGGFLNSPFMQDMSAVWTRIGGAIAKVGSYVGSFVSGIWNFFAQGIPRIVDTVHQGMASVYHSMVSSLSNAVSWIYGNFIQPVVGMFQSLWTQIDNFFGGIFSSIANTIGGAARWIYDNFASPVIQVFSAIGKFIDNLFGGIFSSIRNTIGSWFNWVVEKYNQVAHYFGLDAKVGSDWNKIDITDINSTKPAEAANPVFSFSSAMPSVPSTRAVATMPTKNAASSSPTANASASEGGGGKSGTNITIQSVSFATGATFQNASISMSELERQFREFLLSVANDTRLSTN